ncbi:hypothetical protein EPI10_031532 [Gossypium australe]|uniref:Uncharacterized protein n=1 Tax=Gossypium australe TaxID=47621 RepID=A0A5B6X0I0_9ROSI|nr:hypothetical protein EPI10_031532 [Gossypium australe]
MLTRCCVHEFRDKIDIVTMFEKSRTFGLFTKCVWKIVKASEGSGTVEGHHHTTQLVLLDMACIG